MTFSVLYNNANILYAIRVGLLVYGIQFGIQGRRRVINVRNGGRDEIGTRDEAEPVEDYGGGSSSGGGGGHKMVTNDDAPMVAAEKEKGADDAEEPVVTVEDIARMVC